MNEQPHHNPARKVHRAAIYAALGLCMLIMSLFFVSTTWSDVSIVRNKQFCTGTRTQGCIIKEQAALIKVYRIVRSEADPLSCAVDIRLKDGTVKEGLVVPQSICKNNPTYQLLDKKITVHRWGSDTILSATIDGYVIRNSEGPAHTLMFSLLGAWFGYAVMLRGISGIVYRRRVGKAPPPAIWLWVTTGVGVALIGGLIINVSSNFVLLLAPLAIGMAVFELFIRTATTTHDT